MFNQNDKRVFDEEYKIKVCQAPKKKSEGKGKCGKRFKVLKKSKSAKHRKFCSDACRKRNAYINSQKLQKVSSEKIKKYRAKDEIEVHEIEAYLDRINTVYDLSKRELSPWSITTDYVHSIMLRNVIADLEKLKDNVYKDRVLEITKELSGNKNYAKFLIDCKTPISKPHYFKY